MADMPLFYFHFWDGENFSLDDLGIELPGADFAYVEAAKAAQAMWSELLSERHDPQACRFHVEDASGAEIFDLRFSELMERCNRNLMPQPAELGTIRRALEQTYSRAANARTDVRASLDNVHRSLNEFRDILNRTDSAGSEA